MRRYYYDIRFLLLPALALLQSYYAGEEQTMSSSSSSSSFVVEMVFFSALLAAFLLSTIRIQLFAAAAAANGGRRLELRCGRSALSVPLILSLTITLFVPLSSLVNAYLVILVVSVWSDPIHHFITRFSYAEERRLMLLPVTLAQHPTLLLLTPN